MNSTNEQRAESVAGLRMAFLHVIRRPAPALAWSLVLLCSLAILAGTATAQQNSLADRLPADTWVYLHWQGTSSLNAGSSTNSVIRFWRDPSFAAARQSMIERMTQEAKQNNPKANGFTQEDAGKILSLLENQFVFGFMNQRGNQNGNGPNSNARSTGSFLIYDASGKQGIIEKFQAERAKNSGSSFTRTPLPIGSVTGYKILQGKNTSYEAQAGQYFVRTDTLEAMEELLPRLSPRYRAAASFEEAAAVPSACRNGGQGTLLSFLALPGRLNLSEMPANPNFNFAAFAKTLHLDQIHAVCGSVMFEAERTRIRGAVLGDTSQGSVLNIIGDGRENFATLALAPSGAAYQCSILDFVALYKTLMAGMVAALPPDKAGFAAGIESLASTLWGMSPTEALGLFTGEFATINFHSEADPTRAIYAFTIQRPERVLALLKHVIPGASTTQKQEGDTTYVTITFPQNPRAAQNAASGEPSEFFLAVTPSILIATKQRDVLRDAVARLHTTAGSAQADSLSNDPGFKKARAAMHSKISALSYSDLAHYNWTAMINTIEKGMNERAEAEAKRAGKPAPAPVQLLPGFDPAIISRYLHSSSGSAWKDSTGIYFDSVTQ
ncbi:MAG TPA: hypothetical protein VGU63_12075 [Candidatus Acidoferrales bacterium]|nr:hypothetical protein [Candidatus Acidoferrales bacterium]